MTYRDSIGNPVQEGDAVAIGIGLGQTSIGQIVRTDSVLSSNPNSQPMVHIAVTFSLPAAPNGAVAGIVKAVQPTPQVSE